MENLLCGPHAAVLTPRNPDHSINDAGLRSLLRFHLKKGIKGFAIGGATGEFCSITEDELRRILDIVVETVEHNATFVVGIGAADLHGTLRRGEIARRAGATAALLSMPYFFPYGQDDLGAFAHAVASGLDLPILLYNLPQFTSGLDPELTLKLIQQCPSIVGIKDSSGSLDTLRLLTREAPQACRIVGNDSALAQALQEGVADAVISGVACAFPELIASFFVEGATVSPSWSKTVSALESVIAQLNQLPTPWGLKIFAEARGLTAASFLLPLSQNREQLRVAMAEWYLRNRDQLFIDNSETE
jgi:4-hydroxy-tetrahydrodipicolinate synthase